MTTQKPQAKKTPPEGTSSSPVFSKFDRINKTQELETALEANERLLGTVQGNFTDYATSSGSEDYLKVEEQETIIPDYIQESIEAHRKERGEVAQAERTARSLGSDEDTVKRSIRKKGAE